MSHEAEQYVREGMWSLVLIPETFCIESLAHVKDYFDDLIDVGLRDHVQYPTGVFPVLEEGQN